MTTTFAAFASMSCSMYSAQRFLGALTSIIASPTSIRHLLVFALAIQVPAPLGCRAGTFQLGVFSRSASGRALGLVRLARGLRAVPVDDRRPRRSGSRPKPLGGSRLERAGGRRSTRGCSLVGVIAVIAFTCLTTPRCVSNAPRGQPDVYACFVGSSMRA